MARSCRVCLVARRCQRAIIYDSNKTNPCVAYTIINFGARCPTVCLFGALHPSLPWVSFAVADQLVRYRPVNLGAQSLARLGHRRPCPRRHKHHRSLRGWVARRRGCVGGRSERERSHVLGCSRR